MFHIAESYQRDKPMDNQNNILSLSAFSLSVLIVFLVTIGVA